jgi:hypothetical protein
MIRGTTPTFKFKVNSESVDFTKADNVYVTFSQGTTSLTKMGGELTLLPNEVDVYLTQEETLGFATSCVDVQINWTYDTNKRASTQIASVNIGRNLINEVLS